MLWNTSGFSGPSTSSMPSAPFCRRARLCSPTHGKALDRQGRFQHPQGPNSFARHQATGEVRPDDRQFGYFPCRNSGFGRSSAILCSGGALRDGFACRVDSRVALSKAPNCEIIAPEPGPIRRIPVESNRGKRFPGVSVIRNRRVKHLFRGLALTRLVHFTVEWAMYICTKTLSTKNSRRRMGDGKS
jgi:hypothetical protein